jgi:PIN domain nuclease of toxin-antitoxin system
MKVLLDTHAFIWWDDEDFKLSSTAFAVCRDLSTTLLLSVVSVWEMQVKIQLGKLNFTVPLKKKIENQQQNNQLEILPLNLNHVFTLEQLPLHHRDPFDRLLIAQAVYENIPFISHDPEVSKYVVQVIW